MAVGRDWRDVRPGEHRHTREVVTYDQGEVEALRSRVDQLEASLRQAVEALTGEMAQALRSLHDQAQETRAMAEKADGTLLHISRLLPREVA